MEEKLNCSDIGKRKRIFASALFCFAAAAAAVVSYFLYVRKLAPAHPTLAKAFLGVIVLCCALSVLSYVLIVVLRAHPLKSYLCIAFIAALIIGTAVPPNLVPDEKTHYYNAYCYSNTLVGKSEWNDGKYINVRACDKTDYRQVLSAETYYKIFNDLSPFNRDSADAVERVRVTFVSSSPAYVYTPQALGLSLGRALNLSGLYTYLMCRFFNLLFFFALLCLAIKIIPFSKHLLAVFGTVPIALQQAMSASSDPFIFGLSLVIFAMAMKIMFGKEKVSWRDLIAYTALSMLFAPCKLVYFAIPLIVVFTPKERFESKAALRFTRYLIPVLTVASLVLLQFGNLADSTDDVTAGTAFSDVPTYSIHFIYREPLKFVVILLNTLRHDLFYYFRSMMCSSFGQVEVASSGILPVIYTAVFIVCCFPKKESDRNYPEISKFIRFISIALFFGTCFLTVLSMFVSWTPSDETRVVGVQGRYFLPVLPLAALFLNSKKYPVSENARNYALVAASATTLYTIAYVFGIASFR